jgi:uncharacterized GH25 family protein
MRKFLLAALALSVPMAAQAHEIWIERDGSGPARIYLGEPAEPQPAGGDPEFAKLKAPQIVTPAGATLTRRTGFIEARTTPGDVRLRDDAVFAPWGEAGKREAVVYYARAGRTEAQARLPFELVPVRAGGDRFRLIRDGRPVPGQEVTVIAPDRSQRKRVTDGAGELAVEAQAAGRYLLVAARKETGRSTLPGGVVDAVHHITTTSFTED